MGKLSGIVGVLLLAAACTPQSDSRAHRHYAQVSGLHTAPVPQQLAASPALPRHERAWRFFAGDARNTDAEIATAPELDRIFRLKPWPAT